MSEQEFLAQMRQRAEEALAAKASQEEAQRSADNETEQRTEAEAEQLRLDQLLAKREELLSKVSSEKKDSEELAAAEAKLGEYNEVAEMFAAAGVDADELVEFNEKYDAVKAEVQALQAKGPFNPAAEYSQLETIDSDPAVMDRIRAEAGAMNTEVDADRKKEKEAKMVKFNNLSHDLGAALGRIGQELGFHFNDSQSATRLLSPMYGEMFVDPEVVISWGDNRSKLMLELKNRNAPQLEEYMRLRDELYPDKKMKSAF